MWSTPEQVAAKLAEFEAALATRWERPLAWGLMHEDADGRIVVDRAEAGEQRDLLAMTVLAIATGDCCNTHVTRIAATELDTAITVLEPSEACTAHQQSNLRAWPPRLPDQPIFYPVLSEAYARQIATEWNTARLGGLSPGH